jgi:hypothetical protein
MVRNRRFDLANGADAVTVFMDFVESNAKGKLPIHPSYLELKRILVEHAEFRSSDAEVTAAKALIQTPEPQASPPPVEAQDQHAAVATATKAVEVPQTVQAPTPTPTPQMKAKLPPMRKAAN